MSPIYLPRWLEISRSPVQKRTAQIQKPTDPDGLILEAWAQGFMVGALIIMSCITLANMRRGVLLHKIILAELLCGLWHGFFIFNHPPVYGWYLSVSAIFLNTSWSLHNVVAWMKNKPFLSHRVSMIYIGTVILAQPYWVLEIYANFTYFNNINTLFLHTRPWEALFRDPWWIFTTISLFHAIRTRYEFKLMELLRISPRFAVMLGAMCLSIAFIIVDILSVTDALKSSLPVGVNPFWKLAFVFKCLTDSVILDDFKTALDRMRAFKISRLGSFAVDSSDARNRPGIHTAPWEMVKKSSDEDSQTPLSGTRLTDSERRIRELQRSISGENSWSEIRGSSKERTVTRPSVMHIESRDRDGDGLSFGTIPKKGQTSWLGDEDDGMPRNDGLNKGNDHAIGTAK